MNAMRIIKTICLISVAILTACNLASMPDGTGTGPDTIPEANSGYVSVSIPAIPGYLSDSLSALRKPETTPTPFIPFSSSSKAIGFAPYVEIVIDDGIIQTPYYQNLDIVDPTGYASSTIAVPSGIGYTATVSVFNTAISNSVPMVTGTSEAFDVIAGTTSSVFITALPYSPKELVIDTPDSVTGAIPTVSNDYFDVLSIGGEYWYKISAIAFSDLAAITITHNTGDSLTGFVELAVFDFEGFKIKTQLSPGIEAADGDRDLVYVFNASSGSDYYICILPITLTGDTQSEFTVSYTQGYSDDGYEDNDDYIKATLIDEGVTLNAVAMDSDYYTFDVNQISKVSIDCSLLGYDAELLLRIYDKNLTQVNSATITSYSQNFTDILNAGTYYIDISPQTGSGTYCAEYALSWYIKNVYTDDAYEENDDTFTATPITESETIDAISVDSDYFTFELTSDQTVTINCIFSLAEGDINLYLFKDDFSIYFDSYEYTDNETIDSISLTAGIYYIEVLMASDTPGTAYSISWNTVP